MRAPALALRIGLVLALASCTGSVSMDSRFVTLHNTMAALGMTQSGSISEGSLAEGGEAHFDGRLEPGQCYTVVALGGGGVANLDVVITDEAGTDVAHDATEDGEAAVQFCPQYPAQYRIAVRMTRGGGGYMVTSWSGAPQGSSYATPGYPTYDPYATATATAPVRPPHGGPGTCEAPYALTTSTPIQGDTTDGDSAISGSCIYGSTAPEHVYQFTVEQRSLVRAVLSSAFDGALYFEAACGDPRAELACNDDSPSTSRSEISTTLDPGLYYVVVDGYGTSMGAYEVALSMMAMRSTREVCGGATPLVPGTTVAGNTAAEANYFEATCAGSATSPDRVYSLDVSARSRVRVRMQSSYNGAVYVRSTCADPSTELACNDDYQDSRHALATATLDPGRYYVYADGSDGTSGDYSLTADVVPAAGTGAAGDTCANATAWAPGADLTADTFTMADDAHGSCGGTGAPDAVYRLNLTSRARVRASFTSSEFPPVVYLQRTCGDTTSEVFCMDGRGGVPIDQTLAAGTYYLVVDGADQNAFGAAAVHLQVDDMGALEASCRSAPLIRAGHQITGTTTGSSDRFQATCAGGAASPDQIYRLQIRHRSTVRITSEQTDFDGAIYVRSDCTDQTSELACNDDAGDNHHSMLETELDPGTYYVFMDGFASGNQGAFSLDVDVQTSRP